MKFTITIDVPDGSTIRIDPAETGAAYVPAFEDELIPLPEGATPIPQDPVPFRGAAKGLNGEVCPVHHVAWKVVPAGVSKSTGRPYGPFWGCSSPGKCAQRPTQQFLAAHPLA